MEGRRIGSSRRENGRHRRGEKIILEEQDRRFAADVRQPVEGVIYIRRKEGGAETDIHIRNLKRTANLYKLIFIGRKDNRSVYVIPKEFRPDASGNVSLKLELDTEDVDGKGTGLSCFFIFMIAAAGKPLRPVLKGDIQERTGQEEPEKALGERLKERKMIAVPVKTYNSYYNEYIRNKTAELIGLCSELADVSPFDDEWLADNWKRVTDAVKFPVASSGAEQQIRKYGHFIFGTEGNHFYLAVPGRHTEDEWPDRGKSGFVMWQSIRSSEEYGYWCMVIDWKTGIITEIS